MAARLQNHRQTKKLRRPTTRELTAATFMLRCHDLGLSCADQDEYSIGMVTDMLVERGNDQETYPIKAGQEEIDKLLGG